MATYKELMAKKAALDEQIEAARKAEVEQVVQQIRQIMQDNDLTVEDLAERVIYFLSTPIDGSYASKFAPTQIIRDGRTDGKLFARRERVAH